MPVAHLVRRCCFSTGQRGFSSISTPVIKENDVLLLRQEGAKYAKWHLTAPLRPGRRIRLSYGSMLSADDLIGKNVQERIKDEGGRRVVIQRPSLAGYVVHSKRIATPIYPQDAAIIVSLLDLHPTRPGEDDEDVVDNGETNTARTVDSIPFEIFEAGTGMGSLTLHIARAIHAANPPTPRSLRSALSRSCLLPSYVSTTQESADSQSSPPSSSPSSSSSPAPLGRLEEAEQADLQAYRSTRRAILHTLDKNEKHSLEAYKFIRNFRRGQYLPSIDFYTNTTIASFLDARLSLSNNLPFLSRAILDLPAAHDHAGPVLSSLLPNGLLVVFAPSISQIAEFQQWCVATGQSANLERVLELPTTVASETMPDSGAGGRAWDMKVVRKREAGGVLGDWVQVMRPKVGDRVAGGGFVAVIRKLGENGVNEAVEVEGASFEDGEEPSSESFEGEVITGEAGETAEGKPTTP